MIGVQARADQVQRQVLGEVVQTARSSGIKNKVL